MLDALAELVFGTLTDGAGEVLVPDRVSGAALMKWSISIAAVAAGAGAWLGAHPASHARAWIILAAWVALPVYGFVLAVVWWTSRNDRPRPRSRVSPDR